MSKQFKSFLTPSIFLWSVWMRLWLTSTLKKRKIRTQILYHSPKTRENIHFRHKNRLKMTREIDFAAKRAIFERKNKKCLIPR